jgi:trehalose 6-phosphate synthase
VSLVVVSNRVATQKLDEPMTGGLAAALLPVVKNSGAIWVGTNSASSAVRPQKEAFAEIEALGEGALARINLPSAQYRGFYAGFANSVLWPVMHSRPDLVRATDATYHCYRQVNEGMARGLLRFLKPDTIFWIHDYHFLTLGSELRHLGIEQPIGFFLHTPFPRREVILNLPHRNELIQAMLAYDLVGFQTDDDRANFAEYVEKELRIPANSGTIVSEWGTTQLATCPIEIDAKAFADRAVKAFARPEVTRLRHSLQGAKLAIGVDRIDYSKGLANRFRALDRLLQSQPALKRDVCMLQIAVPSRVEIDTYRDLHAELATLVGEINGRHAEVDWIPIRYLNKGFGQATLAGFYRAARIGLVTPLHDGMNLVAKEYVAAQNPLDPGVLVLSEFAGAAKQLDAALLVNPHDIDGLARAIGASLTMPLAERCERWSAMMARLQSSSLHSWFSDFVALLKVCASRRRAAEVATAVVIAPSLRRVELAAIHTR